MAPTLDADKIVGGLYIGSAPRADIDYKAHGFDVILLCAAGYQPASLKVAKLLRFPLMDSYPMSKDEFWKNWQSAQTAAAVVEGNLRVGKTVLVTCEQGRNRSALVCALTLWRRAERPGWYWLNYIRAKRRTSVGSVLVNPLFEKGLQMLPVRDLTKKTG